MQIFFLLSGTITIYLNTIYVYHQILIYHIVKYTI